ncbi:hypothetical protein ACJX0J_034928, partial [Zea mays]
RKFVSAWIHLKEIGYSKGHLEQENEFTRGNCLKKLGLKPNLVQQNDEQLIKCPLVHTNKTFPSYQSSQKQNRKIQKADEGIYNILNTTILIVFPWLTAKPNKAYILEEFTRLLTRTWASEEGSEHEVVENIYRLQLNYFHSRGLWDLRSKYQEHITSQTWQQLLKNKYLGSKPLVQVDWKTGTFIFGLL